MTIGCALEKLIQDCNFFFFKWYHGEVIHILLLATLEDNWTAFSSPKLEIFC